MPSLVSANCPRCGAGVRLEPNQDVTTCTYCGLSSFVHRPGASRPRPVVPPGTELGDIHLAAVKRAFVLPVILAGVGLVAAVGMSAALFAVRAPGRTSSVAAPSPNVAPQPTTPAKPQIRAANLAQVELASIVVQAREAARKVEPRAELTSFVAFKTTNGTLDLTGEQYASLTFEYLYQDKTKPPGQDSVEGRVHVMAKKGELSVNASPGGASRLKHGRDGTSAALSDPACTSNRLWEAAVKSGVAANSVADIHLYENKVFTPQSPVVWSIRVDGHDEFRREIDAATCKVAKSWAKK